MVLIDQKQNADLFDQTQMVPQGQLPCYQESACQLHLLAVPIPDTPSIIGLVVSVAYPDPLAHFSV